MKKIQLGLSLLAAVTLFFSSCNKGTNTAPEQDMEFQSSKDVSLANSLVTELEIIVSYAAERLALSPVFQKAPASPGSVTCDLSDTLNKKITIVYSGSVTCRDGKQRNGSIVIDYSPSNATLGSKYYRDAGFSAKVTLNAYWVDGWLINDTEVFTINNITPSGFDPKQVDLKWVMKGNMHLQYIADTNKNMVWNGTLTKTLLNTESSSIFTSKFNQINWVLYSAGTPTNGAQLAYTGTVTGVTSRLISYNYEIDATKPENALVRNLVCAPDRILAAVQTTNGLVPVYSEWHPIISGVASFTSLGPGTTEPRKIDYSSGETTAPCDNAGTVTIKGVTYSIDFRK